MQGLADLRVCCAPALWPFLDYPMFSQAHGLGAKVEPWVLTVHGAGGESLRLDLIGGDEHKLEARRAAGFLLRGQRAALHAWAGDFRARAGFAITELRLWREVRVLERRGVSSGTLEPFLSYPLSSKR